MTAPLVETPEPEIIKATKPMVENSGSKANEGRRVKFNMEANTVKLIQWEFEGIVDQIWFSADEYVRIKGKSREESRAWRRHGFGVLLKQTFETPNDKTQQYLDAFCRLEGDLARRGLERHLSRQHAEERSDRKDASRQAVFMTQQRLGQRKLTDAVELPDRISAAYKDQCRQAKVFARRIGQADEKAIQEGEDSSLAQTIVAEMDDRAGVGHRKMERRLSNFSTVSMNSLDSRRRWQAQPSSMTKSNGRRCPGSPASAMEEYYAAIA